MTAGNRPPGPTGRGEGTPGPASSLDPAPFDPAGPLPGPGVTLLEASAGTGKTYTIAALVARYVAAGVALDDVLAVTFSRMATAELRDRVRARLVTTEAHLGSWIDTGAPVPPDDTVATLLATGDPAEVRVRRSRLADAVAGFDGATIATTHGFCHLVLAGLGVSGQVAVGSTLVEDPGDALDEVVDDLLLRRSLGWGLLPFSHRSARDVARAAVANPVTDLVPGRSDRPGGLQRRLAEGVRAEVGLRLRDANLLTYDDLLVRLAATLADPARGGAACALLQARYRVVLVDEFQDTDPVQWDIVERAFGGGATTLVLIGDPKQAIYAFRGADIYSYLEAARRADHRYTLTVNWRSDAGLLAAYDALLDPLHVGHPEIRYRTVTATPAHQAPGLVAAPVATPLRVRVLHSADRLVRTTKSGAPQKDAAVAWIAGDVAADVVELLASPACIRTPDVEAGGRAGGHRPDGPVSAGDIAVLVRTNQQAMTVQDALRRAGVPAVVGGTDSVFATEAGRDWLRLLEAFEQPSSRARATAVALTPFAGLSAREVVRATEADWEALHARILRWAEMLRRHGVASVARSVLGADGVAARILAETSGERRLTDLGHVAQLLHAAGAEGQLGPSALRAWLGQRIEESADRTASDVEERSRRLDSDARAVQVLTVHRAKGLEFPVVYCPYLWDPGPGIRSGEPVVFHDPGEGFRRALDVGAADDDDRYRDHFDRATVEQRGEELRLLYVALTRARHQAVIWWARGYHSRHSALGRILMCRDATGEVGQGRYDPKDVEVVARLDQVAERSGGRISVERCAARPTAARSTSEPVALPMRVAGFDRSLDATWRRTSYTAITAFDHGEAVGSEPEYPGLADEPPGTAVGGIAAGADPRGRASGVGPRATGDEDREDREGEERLRAVSLPLGGLPGGAEVGVVIHRVLERTDFAAADRPAALGVALSDARIGRALDLGEDRSLIEGLDLVLDTPLGPLVDDRRLRDFDVADRLDELAFELPLAGGDTPSGEVRMADVADLLRRYHPPAGGPTVTDPMGSEPMGSGRAASGPGGPSRLVGYADRLETPRFAGGHRGYLTGSLDLVVRVRRPGRPDRYVLADYKTNRLAEPGESLSAWHYRPAALEREMERAHYPLQAVLYLVALHRYLRWRLPGYDPEANLGGVAYLFLRGMIGPDTPTVGGERCGVWSWATPPALVVELSDLFDRGASRPPDDRPPGGGRSSDAGSGGPVARGGRR